MQIKDSNLSHQIFCLDPDYLDNLATKYSQVYIEGKPFPHIIIDDFLPEEILDGILKEFPQANQIKWQQFDDIAQKKLASTSELQMGVCTKNLLYQLNSGTFINFLEKLTSIDGLIPDPHFQGGGLHQIERGGFLKIHADFNRHTKMKLDRRLNLLIYLNKNWKEEYGGHFELWDRDMTKCEQKVLPIFNRCVIFSTSDYSYHGHPEPLNCPEGWTRKSLALYYYSNGRPEEEISNDHTTLFRERPEENLQEFYENVNKKNWKNLAKKFIPPIVLDLKNRSSHKN
jgi:Rps23 Pro-64 3,4-dihydroxylase Tpa1-like proline 4-hydroxylase